MDILGSGPRQAEQRAQALATRDAFHLNTPRCFNAQENIRYRGTVMPGTNTLAISHPCLQQDGTRMIEKLHAELLALADRLQDAGVRGLYNLKHAPYRGMQWKHRAYQRDSYVVAFTQELPPDFGTFKRREDLIAQRRLVFHSDALDLDLVLRRRGSFRRSSAVSLDDGHAAQGLFPEPERRPVAADATRLAALIWDTPRLTKKHEALGPTPIAVRLALPGHALDDNQWQSGFLLPPVAGHDLIPDRAEYRHDMADWDVENENESDAQ
jgi:hypothetical protein